MYTVGLKAFQTVFGTTPVFMRNDATVQMIMGANKVFSD
jgi:hypothetical protein